MKLTSKPSVKSCVYCTTSNKGVEEQFREMTAFSPGFQDLQHDKII